MNKLVFLRHRWNWYFWLCGKREKKLCSIIVIVGSQAKQSLYISLPSSYAIVPIKRYGIEIEIDVLYVHPIKVWTMEETYAY